MLIHYSISGYEVLENKLSEAEKEEVYNVFYRVGVRMGLKELPLNYIDWLPVREQHLKENLQKSNFTEDLFKQYRKHLGLFRYRLLREAQKLVVPSIVNQLLNFSGFKMLPPVLILYKISKKIKMDSFLKHLLLPKDYKKQIAELDVIH